MKSLHFPWQPSHSCRLLFLMWSRYMKLDPLWWGGGGADGHVLPRARFRLLQKASRPNNAKLLFEVPILYLLLGSVGMRSVGFQLSGCLSTIST